MELKKTTMPGYMRDQKTGAVINMNESEWAQHVAVRKQRLEISDLKSKIDMIMRKIGI